MAVVPAAQWGEEGQQDGNADERRYEESNDPDPACPEKERPCTQPEGELTKRIGRPQVEEGKPRALQWAI